MARYVIQNEFMDNIKGRENVDVVYDEIEPSHVYRNTYYYGENISYEEDRCLNRYDVNDTLLEKIISDKTYSKLWMINPEYLNLNMAIKIANLGKGRYLSQEFKDILEINVLRIIANENDMDTTNLLGDKKDLLLSEKEKVNNIKEYINNIYNKYPELIKEKEYLEEEKRALMEEDKRLNGKMEYCLDIMKDITIAKTKLLQLKK